MAGNRHDTNARNAQRSTGPCTREGKAVVRLNALKHGLLARDILLPTEDGNVFARLRKNLRADLRPVGTLEVLLVDQIAVNFWRLARLHRVETGILVGEVHGILVERAWREVRVFERQTSRLQDLINECDQTTTTIVDKEKHERA